LCLLGFAAVNAPDASGGGFGLVRRTERRSDDSQDQRRSHQVRVAELGLRDFGRQGRGQLRPQAVRRIQGQQNFAVEGGYFNLGKFGYTANATTGSQTGSAGNQGLNLDGVGILPLTQSFRSGSMGLTYTQARARSAA
jgi:hypothetical protein